MVYCAGDPQILVGIHLERLSMIMIQKTGATKIGVWLIKHIVAPLDRWLYRKTDGKLLSTGRPVGPILLLTTTGRRSGKKRTTPVFYLRDNGCLILCNANPGFEQTNPWVLNLRAQPNAMVQIANNIYTCHSREATPSEIDHYWPRLVHLWPAYQQHFERSGQRTIFVLENLQSS